MHRQRTLICGAGGRDFHNFLRLYKDNPELEVVGFTATQIPGIDQRRFPPELAGDAYPTGLPIYPEAELESLIRRERVDRVVFAYSDVSNTHVMQLAARAIGAGADFVIHGPRTTTLKLQRPVIAVSAVRTGCGKSQVARFLSTELRLRGLRVAVVRHPMPYGRLDAQRCQRFETAADLTSAGCTLEEREEYEPHLEAGSVVYAGVDYEAIAHAAESDCDIVLWDGGNNDFPFFAPDFHIVLADALRAADIEGYFPGEAVLRMADLVLINKAASAPQSTLESLEQRIESLRPNRPILRAQSAVQLERTPPTGSRLLIVEDGPTITHGGMPWGAGYVAVKDLDVQLIDPRTCAVAELQTVFEQYPHIGSVLPAMGYSEVQLAALRQTIEASGADVVIAGTPIDLARAASLKLPVIRARYRHVDLSAPDLMHYVDQFLWSAT